MLRKSILCLFAGVLSFGGMAKEIEVSETSYKFDKSNRPALMVSISMVDESTVEKAWKHFIKEYDPEDFDGGSEMFADNATISRVSDNTVDVYASVEEKGDDIILYVAVDLGGAYLSSSHGRKHEAMRGIIHDFALELLEDAYKEKVQAQEKIIGKVEKSIKRSNHEKEHLNKEINSYQEKIEENTLEIEELDKTLKQQEQELVQEQKKLEEIKKEASKIE